jgi:hypothetical protein
MGCLVEAGVVVIRWLAVAWSARKMAPQARPVAFHWLAVPLVGSLLKAAISVICWLAQCSYLADGDAFEAAATAFRSFPKTCRWGEMLLGSL